MSAPADKPLIRVGEAASLAGLTERVLYSWIADGVVPSHAVLKAGRSVYLRRQAFIAFLEGREVAD